MSRGEVGMVECYFSAVRCSGRRDRNIPSRCICHRSCCDLFLRSTSFFTSRACPPFVLFCLLFCPWLSYSFWGARRREAEAVQDRDVRLADLQSKIGELSQAKERAVKDGGSELASLEVKIVGFIKDNSELLRANK